MNNNQSPPSSSLGRFLRLGGTGMRIAGNVLLQRLTPGKSEIDWQPVADLLGDALGQMKGPVLKLGQQASQWQGVLPVPISKALERLQNRVPALPFSALEAHLQVLYDGQLHQLFLPFEPLPAAAASLGQVHRARDQNGQALMVKVQYPGIAAICAADLSQVSRLLPLGRLLGAAATQLDAVYAELKRSITQELDYQAEQDSAQRFYEHFAKWPGLQLPMAIGHLCRPGVLVLEDVPGRSMAEVEHASEAVRQQLALTLCQWLLEQSFGLGLLHADPHPGNLAWTEEGHLVVYDFGCVLEVEPQLLNAYLQLFEALRGPNSAALEPAFQALGGRRLGSNPPFELYDRIHRMMHPLLQPGALWDFRASALHQQLLAIFPQVMAAIGSLQPASGTLLVNRALEGHYWNLYRLGACLPIADLLEQQIQRSPAFDTTDQRPC
ncbi:MAG: putative unusual protein kinase regulating ubiquinone biosynthesis (AarF/ABC1/UbiB family) [Pseudomonas sp.]